MKKKAKHRKAFSTTVSLGVSCQCESCLTDLKATCELVDHDIEIFVEPCPTCIKCAREDARISAEYENRDAGEERNARERRNL